MRIYLVRHGESVAQIDQNNYALYGDDQVPLSKWGYGQAVDAGKALRKHWNQNPAPEGSPKPIIFHSPFLRTTQTTEGLMEGLGTSNAISRSQPDANLTERSHGVEWYIQDPNTFREIFPDEHAAYDAHMEKGDKFNARPPTGESVAEVHKRMENFRDTTLKEAMEAGAEDIVIVGHSNTNRACAMAILGLSEEWYNQSIGQGNADIMLLEGDFENGFSVTPIHESKTRPASLKNEAKPHRPDQVQSVYL